jgi:hypothetical protein
MTHEAVHKVPRAFITHELAPRECGMWGAKRQWRLFGTDRSGA